MLYLHNQNEKQMNKKIKVANIKTGKVFTMTKPGIDSLKKFGLWKNLEILPDVSNQIIDNEIEKKKRKKENQTNLIETNNEQD